MTPKNHFNIPLFCFYSIFYVLHNPIPVSSQCLDEQKILLLALKNDLTFDSSLSTKLVTWNRTADCCDWGGVACDITGHITQLDLSNESINGGIINGSSSLFRLGFLQSVNLAYNNFDLARLPFGFGNLDLLTYLNLSNANFVGQVPGDFSLMQNLKILDLSSNRYDTFELENPDLKSLIQNLSEIRELHLDNMKIKTFGYHWSQVISSFLPNLQVLSLISCSLLGPLDSSLGKLNSLSVIRLDENTFSSDIPESFANLQNLTVLTLRSCNLSGSLPKKLFQTSTLKTIDLSSNLIKGPLPVFPNNGSLENIVLSYTDIGGEIPYSIGNLRMLSTIEFRACKFTGPLPNSIQNLFQLVYFDLSSNQLSGSIPSFHFAKRLISLNLYRNNFTGTIPSQWEGLNSLEFVSFGYNSLIGNFPDSLLTLPLLQDLDLSNNLLSGKISNRLNVISSYNLRNIDLSSNNFEGQIPEFIINLSGLETITLSGNNFKGNVTLDMFGNLKDLYALDLSNNDLTVSINPKNSSFSSLVKLNTLKLASCKMKNLPDLKNQSGLMMLDLSNNELSREIPNWIWEIGNGYLRFLNLSHNTFFGLQKPYTFPFLLDVLDLNSNNLKGEIPIPPRRVYHLDYSNNEFGSSIPIDLGNVLKSTLFFSISNSKLIGVIPESIRNATSLHFLNLSHNLLSGRIPLIGNLKNLESLDLSVNKLNGSIPEELVNLSALSFLNLSYNHLSGRIPQGSKFQTFTELSFVGNEELCGPPLKKSCDNN